MYSVLDVPMNFAAQLGLRKFTVSLDGNLGASDREGIVENVVEARRAT